MERPLLVGGFVINNYNQMLQISEKRVIKGVVTEKQMVEKDCCFIVISMNLRIQILLEEYKTLTVGDIIRMEMTSDDPLVRKQVVVEGRI